MVIETLQSKVSIIYKKRKDGLIHLSFFYKSLWVKALALAPA